MKFDKLKTGFTNFCRRVGKRNFIIFGAVLLTVVAVGVNLIIFSNSKDDNFDYDQSAGMDAGTTQPTTAPESTNQTDSYFSSVAVKLNLPIFINPLTV